jgi:TetR/AcrR family transcriptional repressor of mexJK operon
MTAASHFVGMLLWIPINEAMFTGDPRLRTPAELIALANSAADAFLAAYGPPRDRHL